jgi:hypothetical protein
LGVGEILDVSFKVYLRNFLTFIAIVAIIYVPLGILATAGILSVLPSETEIRDNSFDFGAGSDTTFLIFFFIFAFIAWLLTFVATAAGVRAVTDAYLGEKPGIRRSYAYGFRRFHSLLWVVILFALAVALASIALVIPGIYLAVAFSVAVPALVVEGVKGTKALGRSYNLVQGRWWVTFGALILGWFLIPLVVQYAIGFAFGIPLTAIDPSSTTTFVALNQLSGTLAQIVSAPLQATVLTVIYFDLRVRKEAFDIQLLADRIDSPATDPRTLPPSG